MTTSVLTKSCTKRQGVTVPNSIAKIIMECEDIKTDKQKTEFCRLLAKKIEEYLAQKR